MGAVVDERIDRLHAAHPSGHLQAQVSNLQEPPDHAPVVTASPRRIQVHDVQPLGAGCDELRGHLDRIIRINGRVFVVALRQPHAATGEDVDGGNHDHAAHGAPVRLES